MRARSTAVDHIWLRWTLQSAALSLVFFVELPLWGLAGTELDDRDLSEHIRHHELIAAGYFYFLFLAATPIAGFWGRARGSAPNAAGDG